MCGGIGAGEKQRAEGGGCGEPVMGVSYRQANVYLQQEYLPEHNEPFRCSEAEDYHRQAPNMVQGCALLA